MNSQSQHGDMDDLRAKYEGGYQTDPVSEPEEDAPKNVPELELKRVTARLVKSDIEYLKYIADELGCGYTQLVRQAVREFTHTQRQLREHVSSDFGTSGNPMAEKITEPKEGPEEILHSDEPETDQRLLTASSS